jgi:alkylation response protein AidB-like acyl-CoA dehydrogenase
VARRSFAACGELGLLGIDVPEAYGGLDLDKTSSLVVAERVSTVASFGVTFGAPGDLCILPIRSSAPTSRKRDTCRRSSRRIESAPTR